MVSVLYLYNKHDADLIGLLEEVGIKDFRNICKDSLRILTRPGYIPKVTVPKYKPYEGEKERFDVFVSIQSLKDADIQELLSHVKYRQFNSFCKMAMRFYLGVIPTMSSMLDMELIKTVPVYTPSGVIVFSNNISAINDRTDKRSHKEKKDTIKKANKAIQKREINNINDAVLTEIPQSVPVWEDKEVDAAIDETDVLSLLEGLLD